jgi:hypothetical protein
MPVWDLGLRKRVLRPVYSVLQHEQHVRCQTRQRIPVPSPDIVYKRQLCRRLLLRLKLMQRQLKLHQRSMRLQCDAVFMRRLQ